MAEGENPSDILVGLERIIGALNPKRPHGVPSVTDIGRKANHIASIAALSRDEFERSYGTEKSQAKYIAESEAELAEGKALIERWQERKLRARKLLSDLGGAAIYKDAKENWDDDSSF